MSKKHTNVVEININNHLYKIACEEGQEDHIQNLAKIINDEVQKLVSSLGQIGETRLLLMTCLIIADKLKENNTSTENSGYDFLLESLKKITQRVERVADKIK